jgi:hypothetical protein
LNTIHCAPPTTPPPAKPTWTTAGKQKTTAKPAPVTPSHATPLGILVSSVPLTILFPHNWPSMTANMHPMNYSNLDAIQDTAQYRLPMVPYHLLWLKAQLQDLPQPSSIIVNAGSVRHN